MTFLLVLSAWELRDVLLPAGWTENEWLLWLFAFSPGAVSVQFAIGVVAYRLSSSAARASW